jgi:group I intron endonuclease
MTIGIYKITCTENGKFYIGSSVDLKERIGQHKRALAQKMHCNRKLQRSYDKYGKDKFVFEILETFIKGDVKFVRQVEQGYLNIMQPFDERGFNLQRSTQLTYTKSDKPRNFLYLLISPAGEVYHNFKFLKGKKVVDKEKPNVRQLSINLGVDDRSIGKIASGTEKSYKGWTSSFYYHQIIKEFGSLNGLKEKKKPWYTLQREDGVPIRVRNVKKFARENKVDYTGIHQVLKGKINYFKGWFNAERFKSLDAAINAGKEKQLEVHRKALFLNYQNEVTLWARSRKDASILIKSCDWFQHKPHRDDLGGKKLQKNKQFNQIDI